MTIEKIYWIILSIVGILTFINIIFEINKSTQQRRKEAAQRDQDLLFRKVESAQDLIHKCLTSPESSKALEMLDWTYIPAYFKSNEGEIEKFISWDEIYNCLKIDDYTPPPGVEFNRYKFIRDSFDNLFFQMSMIEHFIQRRLISFEDIQYPFDYYIREMNVHYMLFNGYLNYYQFSKTIDFLKRFSQWNNIKEQKSFSTSEQIISPRHHLDNLKGPE